MIAVDAVAVAGEVEGHHPELLGEGRGHVGPPVRVRTATVHEDESARGGVAPGEVVDRPVDVDRPVGARHPERASEPVRGGGIGRIG